MKTSFNRFIFDFSSEISLPQNQFCVNPIGYTPPHTSFLGTHHYTPYVLVHITTHLICLGTHHYTPYMLWYTPLHTLHALIVQCATLPYIVCNSTLQKDEICALVFLNNSNSFRLTKLRLTVHVVRVLTYIHTKVIVSMMCRFRAISKVAEDAQLHFTRRYLSEYSNSKFTQIKFVLATCCCENNLE